MSDLGAVLSHQNVVGTSFLRKTAGNATTRLAYAENFAGRTSKDRKGGEVRLKKSFRSYVGDAQYLKKEDLSDPVDTELLWVKEEEVTPPGKGTKTRLVASFDGLPKGLVLNTANCEILDNITGTNDPNEWKDIQ